ncbi:unnamed protein product [Aspergillus oryzae]|nr:unnamed protein product [Aspergillus oryzae]
MSANHLLQLFLDEAKILFSQLPPNAQNYLSRPFVHKAIALVAAIQSLRIANRYLSQRAQNNWVRSRPWDASKELVLLTGGMDLTSSAAIKEIATKIRRDHGHPTVLINNAGVGFGGTILDEPEEKIRLTVEVNTLAHFWTVKEFLPSMIKNDHGHIVNIASMASFVALGEMADYACSKAGALAFHESLTQEIKHCVIHPLWVQTPMINDLAQYRSQFGQPIMTPEKVSQAVMKQLVNGNGGQVVVPSSQGLAAMIRGLPNWIQERLRDRASQNFVRLRRLEQELAGSLAIWDYALSKGSPEEEGREEPQIVIKSSATQDAGERSPSESTHSGSSTHLEVEDFYVLHDIYMFGLTFAKDFQQALEYCYRHSADLLGETFAAISSCLSWARFGLLTADQVDVRSGAASVEKLRNAVIVDTHDALAVLMLGQALAAFDSLVTSTGEISILRCSLSLVRPWYPDIARNRLLEPIAIAPIFWDTVWCLLHREVPVIRPLFNRAGVVDRVAGLCTSLLSILYDLCVVSKQLADGSVQETILEEVEHRIRTWSPDDSGLCLETYSELEILSMRTQATMYRTAALLLIHRLRHPLTFEDMTATALASDILDARSRFFADAGTGVKLQNTTFPLFLALLEIPISLEGLWESSTWLRTRPACVDRLFVFNQYYWDQRRSGFNGSLFDLIESGPGFVPGP